MSDNLRDAKRSLSGYERFVCVDEGNYFNY